MIMLMFLFASCHERELPNEEGCYPELLPTCDGRSSFIWHQNEAQWVVLHFQNALDERMYFDSSFEIRLAPDALNSYGKTQAPPCVYFVGNFCSAEDHEIELEDYEKGRPILYVKKWFFLPPLYELDSELAVLVDIDKTKKKEKLEKSDLGWRSKEELQAIYHIPFDLDLHNENIVRLTMQRYSTAPHYTHYHIHDFVYPVVGMDTETRKVDLLLACNDESKTRLKCDIKFPDNPKKMNAFFSKENVDRVKHSHRHKSAPRLFVIGKYDSEQKTFLAKDFITEL